MIWILGLKPEEQYASTCFSSLFHFERLSYCCSFQSSHIKSLCRPRLPSTRRPNATSRPLWLKSVSTAQQLSSLTGESRMRSRCICSRFSFIQRGVWSSFFSFKKKKVVHHHRSRPDSGDQWLPYRRARTVSVTRCSDWSDWPSPWAPSDSPFLSILDTRNCSPREACTGTCGWGSSRPTTRIPCQTRKPKTSSLRNCSRRPPPQALTTTECICVVSG